MPPSILALELLWIPDGELASGAPTSRRRTVDRRSARKSKREEAKNRKSQYFSRQREDASGSVSQPALVKKRPASVVDESRPAKRPKFKEDTLDKPLAPSPVAKTPAPTSRAKPLQTPLERLATKRPAPTDPLAAKPRHKDVEDDEIAWLEAKLGLGKKKQGKRGKDVYGGAFSADGLDGECYSGSGRWGC
jgi:nucleolar MIF4G domain-containing protein 1